MNRIRFLAVLVALLAITGCGGGFAPNVSHWPNVKYTEVKAYAWPAGGENEPETLIRANLSLEPGVLNPDGATLSSAQTERLLAAVTAEHETVGPYKCYEPHNALVFYDGGKPVAFVEVCFTCKGNRAQPPGVAEHIYFAALQAIFKELKLPTGEKQENKL